MATVNPTIHAVSDNVIKVTWTLTSTDDTGAPLPDRYMEYTDRTMYALGTWGGATLKMQGGDGTTYVTAPDTGGSDISLTADGAKLLGPVFEALRPKLTTAGSGASIAVTLVAVRPPRGR